MNGRNTVITPNEWQTYLQRWGYRENDVAEILRRAENIPADRLDVSRKARLLTFLKAIKHEASLDDVKAALVSFFFKIVTKIVNSNFKAEY